MHAKRVRAGKAALSSPTRSQRDSPPLVGMRSSLVGTRARGEGEPHAQDAHVTDAAMVRLNVEPETPYNSRHTHNDG